MVRTLRYPGFSWYLGYPVQYPRVRTGIDYCTENTQYSRVPRVRPVKKYSVFQGTRDIDTQQYLEYPRY